ncbi:unnamed protein product, partial [Musa hybrid cultivar]
AIYTPTRWFVTTRHDMAAILVQLLVSALLLLLLVTNGASSARPHPPPASAGEAPKAPRRSSTLAEKESEAGASRKRVPPSGPSNKGHGSPESSTRHLLHLHADHGCAGRQRSIYASGYAQPMQISSLLSPLLFVRAESVISKVDRSLTEMTGTTRSDRNLIWIWSTVNSTRRKCSSTVWVELLGDLQKKIGVVF